MAFDGIEPEPEATAERLELQRRLTELVLAELEPDRRSSSGRTSTSSDRTRSASDSGCPLRLCGALAAGLGLAVAVLSFDHIPPQAPGPRRSESTASPSDDRALEPAAAPAASIQQQRRAAEADAA